MTQHGEGWGWSPAAWCLLSPPSHRNRGVWGAGRQSLPAQDEEATEARVKDVGLETQSHSAGGKRRGQGRENAGKELEDGAWTSLEGQASCWWNLDPAPRVSDSSLSNPPQPFAVLGGARSRKLTDPDSVARVWEEEVVQREAAEAGGVRTTAKVAVLEMLKGLSSVHCGCPLGPKIDSAGPQGQASLLKTLSQPPFAMGTVGGLPAHKATGHFC